MDSYRAREPEGKKLKLFEKAFWSRKRWGWGDILKEATVKSHSPLAETRFGVCGSHMRQGPPSLCSKASSLPLDLSAISMAPKEQRPEIDGNMTRTL